MSANWARTGSDASKLSATSFCTPAVACFNTPIRIRRRRTDSGAYANSRVLADGSRGSAPAIAASTRPQSSAVRHIGPSLSIDHDRAIAPWRLTRPYVGRSPVTPLNAEGVVIEPHVSLPIANGTSAALTAAPGPDEDPPAQ